MLRLPGCSGNSEETVLAHLRTPETGMGQKEPDLIGAWACRNCHDIVDGRKPIPRSYNRELVLISFYEGIVRTQKDLIRDQVVRW
jgi:hypothetical protein